MAVEWAAAEGWNPGLHDPACFSTADPAGFFVGVWRGEPVACISAVAYDERFGFIGLYIVKPGFRGKGFGIRTRQHGMRYLGDRNIGPMVSAQQANYRKSGFELAYRNIRYEGRVDGIGCAHVVAAADVPFEQLLAYDRQCFPSARERFISTWIAQPDAVALATIDAGRVAGYGVVRRCRTGCKIGPLSPTTRASPLAVSRAGGAHARRGHRARRAGNEPRGRRAGRAARHDERVRNRTDVHERRAGDGNRSRVRGDVVRAGVIVTDMAVAAMATERASMGSRDVFTVVNCGKQPRIFTTCHCIPTCCFCRPALRSTWPSDRTTSSLSNGARNGVLHSVTASFGRPAAFAIMIAITGFGQRIVARFRNLVLGIEVRRRSLSRLARYQVAAFEVYRAACRRDGAGGGPEGPGGFAGETLQTGILRGGRQSEGHSDFTAFFPQFVDPTHYAISFTALGATFLMLELVAIVTYAVIGARLRSLATNPKGFMWLNRASGSLMIGFGVLLAMLRRPAA